MEDELYSECSQNVTLGAKLENKASTPLMHAFEVDLGEKTAQKSDEIHTGNSTGSDVIYTCNGTGYDVIRCDDISGTAEGRKKPLVTSVGVQTDDFRCELCKCMVNEKSSETNEDPCASPLHSPPQYSPDPSDTRILQAHHHSNITTTQVAWKPITDLRHHDVTDNQSIQNQTEAAKDARSSDVIEEEFIQRSNEISEESRVDCVIEPNKIETSREDCDNKLNQGSSSLHLTATLVCCEPDREAGNVSTPLETSHRDANKSCDQSESNEGSWDSNEAGQHEGIGHCDSLYHDDVINSGSRDNEGVALICKEGRETGTEMEQACNDVPQLCDMDGTAVPDGNKTTRQKAYDSRIQLGTYENTRQTRSKTSKKNGYY